MVGAGDAFADAVDVAGDLNGTLDVVCEEAHEELDDVFVGVLFVVPDDDVVVGLALGFGFAFGGVVCRGLFGEDGDRSFFFFSGTSCISGWSFGDEQPLKYNELGDFPQGKIGALQCWAQSEASL